MAARIRQGAQQRAQQRQRQRGRQRVRGAVNRIGVSAQVQHTGVTRLVHMALGVVVVMVKIVIVVQVYGAGLSCYLKMVV
jgi:hypothetical protein